MPSEGEIRRRVRRLLDELQREDESASESGESLSEAGEPEAAGLDARIALGADHGGFHLKEKLASYLRDQGFTVRDCGTFDTDAVDYPDIAETVARLVSEGSCRWGVVVDGAGIGSCMAANKVPGVRAALCYDISSARNSREHNHANVLTLGAGLIGESLARQIVDAWLRTSYGPGRHARRVEKIGRIEARSAGRGGGT
jgi:ribose 5-phosphate isomerase B